MGGEKYTPASYSQGNLRLFPASSTKSLLFRHTCFFHRQSLIPRYDHNTMQPIWTFLPGLHGNTSLFAAIENEIPEGIDTEFIELPITGNQNYTTLSSWLNEQLTWEQPRLLIAESFGGPLALSLAKLRATEISGIVLAASFCDTPVHPNLALLPLRLLFMVTPPHQALRHFLIGKGANEEEITSLRQAIQKTPAATLASRVRAILELQEHDNPPLSDTPILLLQAQDDNLIPWNTQQRLEACYPHASVHWLDSPHLILQRRPRLCFDAIQEFLGNLNVVNTASIRREKPQS